MMVSGLNANVATKSSYSLSDDAVAALRAGNIEALIDSHKARFGGFVMEDDGDDDDDKDEKDGDDDGDSGADDKDGQDDDDTSGDDDEETKAALKRMEKRMKAADKRAADAEKELKKRQDAEKDDLTKATDRVTELEDEVGTLREQLQSERLNNAFLAANKHTWHKPSAALKLAQSEGYLEDVIKDDGTVDEKALGSALNRLAKDNEYLVKPREGAGSSGDSAGGRSGNGKDDKAVKDQDRRRAPALNRRGVR